MVSGTAVDGIDVNSGLAIILVVFGGLAGAVIGSFAGVVLSRGWRGALMGRSRCDFVPAPAALVRADAAGQLRDPGGTMPQLPFADQ